MKEPDEIVSLTDKAKIKLKDDIIAELDAILAEINACILNKTMPPASAFTKASTLAGKYPYNDGFKEIIKAKLDEIKIAEEKAKEVAEKKLEEDGAAERRTIFDAEVARDPIAAAEKYFERSDVAAALDVSNRIVRGEIITQQALETHFTFVGSEESIYVRNKLSENLGVKIEELKLQLDDTIDIDKRNAIARDIDRANESNAKIAQLEIDRQVIEKHKRIYKRENKGLEPTDAELARKKGHHITKEIREVVETIRDRVDGGLAAVGTLVAGRNEAIKEFVEDKDIIKLQAAVTEVKLDNREKAEEKIAIQQVSVAIVDTQIKEDIRQEDVLAVVVVKKEEIKSVEEAIVVVSEYDIRNEEKNANKTKASDRLAAKRAKRVELTKANAASSFVIEKADEGNTPADHTPTKMHSGISMDSHSK